MIDFGLGLGAGVLLTLAAIAAVAWWVNRNREKIIGWVMRRALEAPRAGRSDIAGGCGLDDPAAGLPPDLVRVLRDPTITVARDHEIKLADGRTLFEHLEEWRNAPSNTASAPTRSPVRRIRDASPPAPPSEAEADAILDRIARDAGIEPSE